MPSQPDQSEGADQTSQIDSASRINYSIRQPWSPCGTYADDLLEQTGEAPYISPGLPLNPPEYAPNPDGNETTDDGDLAAVFGFPQPALSAPETYPSIFPDHSNDRPRDEIKRDLRGQGGSYNPEENGPDEYFAGEKLYTGKTLAAAVSSNRIPPSEALVTLGINKYPASDNPALDWLPGPGSAREPANRYELTPEEMLERHEGGLNIDIAMPTGEVKMDVEKVDPRNRSNFRRFFEILTTDIPTDEFGRHIPRHLVYLRGPQQPHNYSADALAILDHKARAWITIPLSAIKYGLKLPFEPRIGDNITRPEFDWFMATMLVDGNRVYYDHLVVVDRKIFDDTGLTGKQRRDLLLPQGTIWREYNEDDIGPDWTKAARQFFRGWGNWDNQELRQLQYIYASDGVRYLSYDDPKGRQRVLPVEIFCQALRMYAPNIVPDITDGGEGLLQLVNAISIDNGPRADFRSLKITTELDVPPGRLNGNIGSLEQWGKTQQIGYQIGRRGIYSDTLIILDADGNIHSIPVGAILDLLPFRFPRPTETDVTPVQVLRVINSFVINGSQANYNKITIRDYRG